MRPGHPSLLGYSILAVLFIAPCTSAQAPPPSDPPAVVTRDGGTDEVLQGIEIPPILKAPFTAILETEWVRPLVDGGTWTVANRRQIARDSSGRIYQERWLLAPKGGKAVSRMSYIQIADPAKHTVTTCSARNHKCILEPYRATIQMAYKPSPEKSGQLANSAGYFTHEKLGDDAVQGEQTTGMRDTTMLNPGVVGNDRPIAIVREFWYSPKLGFNLLSSLSDGRFGTQRFRVTGLVQTEPDPALFELPSGYSLMDQKSASSPE